MPPSFGGKSLVTRSELISGSSGSRSGVLGGARTRLLDLRPPPRLRRVQPQTEEADRGEHRASTERTLVARDRGDPADDERAKALGEVEEAAERADHRRALRLGRAAEREQQQR